MTDTTQATTLMGPKILLEGPSGTGKTHALGTLVDWAATQKPAIPVFVLFTENGLESLLGYWRDHGKEVPDNLHWHYLQSKQRSIEDLRKTATASAIAAATRSARATEPGFGLSEFSKVFGGILTNKPVAKIVENAIGPEAMGMLRDLQTVSKRIAIADSNVLRTGKANQALVGALTADGLVAKVLNSTGGQRVTQAAAIGAEVDALIALNPARWQKYLEVTNGKAKRKARHPR